MRRQLLEALHGYFATIKKRSQKEEDLFLQLHAELPYFHITSVHRDDLESLGFDVCNISDEQMKMIAGKMAEACTEQVFWIDLDIIADYAGVPKKRDRKKYVLVEFPEEAGYFEANDIGYPCFNSEDNGARYVPEEAYIEHFGHEPQAGTYYLPVCWPKSQEYMTDDDSIAALCEPIIADEKALNDFGSSTVWVPLCLINKFK